MLKKIALILMLALPTISFAEDNNNNDITSLGDVAEDVLQQMDEMTNAVKDLFLIMANCDYDNLCIYDTLIIEIEKATGAKKEMYEMFLAGFKKTREELMAQQEKCNTEDLVAVRKVMGFCVKETIHLFDSSDTKFVQALSRCIDERLSPLAEAGNIYAIYTHVDMSEEAGQESKFKDQLEQYEGTDAYNLMQECQY